MNGGALAAVIAALTANRASRAAGATCCVDLGDPLDITSWQDFVFCLLLAAPVGFLTWLIATMLQRT